MTIIPKEFDITRTTASKSDQLNAEDLIGAARTITLSAVRIIESPDQPVILNFEGDSGKPYKPCKSMRRLLAYFWGEDVRAYVGRQLTVYNKPDVKWAGKEVGGIRVNALSHIEAKKTINLAVSRGIKEGVTVSPIAIGATQEPTWTQQQIDEIHAEAKAEANGGTEKFTKWWSSEHGKKVRGAISKNKEIMAEIKSACEAADTPPQVSNEDNPFGDQAAQ